MSSRIDFTDRGIIPIYQDLAMNNTRALEHFLDQMETLARMHAYLPLVIFTNSIVDFYEGDFQNHVHTAFRQWYDSDYSLEQLALKCGAGREAAQRGRRYMDELSSSLDEMFRRSFPKVNADTDSPVLDERDILKVNDEINALIRGAETAKDQALSSCASRSDQNMIYTLLEPMIRNTGESFCESFRSMISKVTEGSELYKMGVDVTIGSATTGVTMEQAAIRWPSYDDFI